MSKPTTTLLFFLVTLHWFTVNGQSESETIKWLAYKQVEDAGFEPHRLEAAKNTFLQQGGTVLLIIRDGHVVLSVGPSTRCFRQTSVRKSYLHALYGIYKERGVISLDATLEELGIEDQQKLTKEEKQATVRDLLQSRSGVYHPAAYSPESMQERLPARGSAGPGERWFYNNWDFNTLGTIFREATGVDIFSAFESEIAQPLGMEDWSANKNKYFYVKDISDHPAYLFRMSPRDMARFGQMYLQLGSYGDRKIIDTTWVQMGFEVHSKNGIDTTGTHWDDYGMLWWISNQVPEQPVYYASGSGVQRITICPESDLLIVHVVDNYQPRSVGEEKVDHLTRLLLDAIVGPVKDNPAMELYEPPTEEISDTSVSSEYFIQYQGVARHPQLGDFQFLASKDHLVLRAGIGDFRLVPTAKDVFINPDMQIPIQFYWDHKKKKGTMHPDISPEGLITSLRIYQ